MLDRVLSCKRNRGEWHESKCILKEVVRITVYKLMHSTFEIKVKLLLASYCEKSTNL